MNDSTIYSGTAINPDNYGFKKKKRMEFKSLAMNSLRRLKEVSDKVNKSSIANKVALDFVDGLDDLTGILCLGSTDPNYVKGDEKFFKSMWIMIQDTRKRFLNKYSEIVVENQGR